MLFGRCEMMGRMHLQVIGIARAIHIGVRRREESVRVLLKQPYMQIIVLEFIRHKRFVTLHWAPEWMTQQLRALFYACSERHEPLGADQLELASDWLVEKNLRVHRIDDWANERWVEKVDAHCPTWVLLVSRFGIVGKIGASDRREVTVMNGDNRVLVFFQ